MVGYMLFPEHESRYDFAETHPSIAAWLNSRRSLVGALPMICCMEGECIALSVRGQKERLV
jgi:hypothetical protein